LHCQGAYARAAALPVIMLYNDEGCCLHIPLPLPNGLIKVRRPWGQRHPQGANSGSTGKLANIQIDRQRSVYSLALAYQVTSAVWRFAGRLPSRLLQNTT
jgi:hypothetical protein